MSSNSHRLETMLLHAGWRADPATGAVAVPIYQTTSYQFRDTEHASNLFALKELGNIYTRIMNPTNDVLEKRIAALEGGAAGLALASGQAASAFALQNLAQAPATTSSARPIFTAAPGICSPTRSRTRESKFASSIRSIRRTSCARPTTGRAPITPKSLPNPKLTVFPIAEVAAIGRPLGIPLIVDNTATPFLLRPLEHGAAIVVYSTTKYLGGHGNSIGGLIVDGGNFDWAAHPERQPALNTPDPSYHGAVWTEAVKPIGPVAYAIKARVTLLRDIGASLSPFNAFLDHPGPGDAGIAHEPALQERPGGGRFPAHAKRDQADHPSVAAAGRPSRTRRPVPQGPVRRAGRLRAGRRQGSRAQVHRLRCSFTIMSPISATREASPSIRRRQRTRSSPKRSSSRPVFRTAMCACRSASSISTTSSPTSSTAWRLQRGH